MPPLPELGPLLQYFARNDGGLAVDERGCAALFVRDGRPRRLTVAFTVGVW